MDAHLEELLEEQCRRDTAPVWPVGRRIALRCHPRGRGIPAHTREHVELFCMVRGTSGHRIGNTGVELGTGELLLLGQNTPQELLPLSDDTIAVSFFLKPELFGDLVPFIGSDDTPLRSFILK